jgi:hypothetical protein
MKKFRKNPWRFCHLTGHGTFNHKWSEMACAMGEFRRCCFRDSNFSSFQAVWSSLHHYHISFSGGLYSSQKSHRKPWKDKALAAATWSTDRNLPLFPLFSAPQVRALRALQVFSPTLGPDVDDTQKARHHVT